MPCRSARRGDNRPPVGLVLALPNRDGIINLISGADAPGAELTLKHFAWRVKARQFFKSARRGELRIGEGGSGEINRHEAPRAKR